MKILKRIGLVVVLLLAVYIVLALIAPSKMHVERKTVIMTSAATVFDEINTIKQWQQWSYWDNIDPKMQSTYEGPESGVGAVHKWTSENDSVGNGTLTIMKSEPTSLVECKLEFEGMGAAVSGWNIKDTVGGVCVTAYMDGETPFLMRPMMLFMDMDAILGSDFEKTLAGLKKHCESLPSPEMTAEYTMEISPLPAMKLMTIADSCNAAELGQKFGGLYGEIGAEMKKQGLNQNGPVLAIYDRADRRPDGTMYFVFRAGVPVDAAGKSAGKVQYQETASSNAVKCNYYGGYSNLSACHDAIDKYITANGKKINGPAWELYVSDPGMEPDSTKWLTEIYYQVE